MGKPNSARKSCIVVVRPAAKSASASRMSCSALGVDQRRRGAALAPDAAWPASR